MLQKAKNDEIHEFQGFQFFLKKFAVCDLKMKMWLGGGQEHTFPRFQTDSWVPTVILEATSIPAKISRVTHFCSQNGLQMLQKAKNDENHEFQGFQFFSQKIRRLRT